jgi:hypothetical protein
MIRWIARVISALVTAFWLMIMIINLLCECVVGYISISWENTALVFLVASSTLSAILAWRKEGAGGLVMILWGIVFAIVACLTSRPYQMFSMLITGVPYVIAGSLFLASWWRSRAEILL